MLVRSLDVGGLEVMTLHLARALRRAGVEVEICCVEALGAMLESAVDANIKVHSLDKGPGFKPSKIWQLADLLRQREIQIVHSHNPLAHFYGALAAALVPGCVNVHSKHEMFLNRGWRQILLARLATRFTRVFVGVSSEVTRIAVKECWVRPSRCRTIPNGLELDGYLGQIAGFKTDRNPLVIGTVGRLSAVKNQTLLLKAFAVLGQNGQALRLRIVGDGEQRAALEQLAKSLELTDKIDFVGYRSDIAAQLREIDLFVLSSASEGMPLVLIEAMAAARPIVATAVGGVPEMLNNGDCGVLVASAASADQLADAIGQLLSSPEQAAVLGQAARDWAQARYGADAMADQYCKVYESAMPSLRAA